MEKIISAILIMALFVIPGCSGNRCDADAAESITPRETGSPSKSPAPETTPGNYDIEISEPDANDEISESDDEKATEPSQAPINMEDTINGFSIGYFSIEEIESILNSSKSNIEFIIGRPDHVEPGGIRGSRFGFVYEDHDFTVFYNSKTIVNYIECGDNVFFHGLTRGSTFEQIKEILGESDVVKETDEEGTTLYNLRYIINGRTYEFSSYNETGNSNILRIYRNFQESLADNGDYHEYSKDYFMESDIIQLLNSTTDDIEVTLGDHGQSHDVSLDTDDWGYNVMSISCGDSVSFYGLCNGMTYREILELAPDTECYQNTSDGFENKVVCFLNEYMVRFRFQDMDGLSSEMTVFPPNPLLNRVNDWPLKVPVVIDPDNEPQSQTKDALREMSYDEIQDFLNKNEEDIFFRERQHFVNALNVLNNDNSLYNQFITRWHHSIVFALYISDYYPGYQYFYRDKFPKAVASLSEKITGSPILYGDTSDHIYLFAIGTPLTDENQKYREAVSRIRGREDEYDFLLGLYNLLDSKGYYAIDMYVEDGLDLNRKIPFTGVKIQETPGTYSIDERDRIDNITEPIDDTALAEHLKRYNREANYSGQLFNRQWNLIIFPKPDIIPRELRVHIKTYRGDGAHLW